jgi:hypothetical protein
MYQQFVTSEQLQQYNNMAAKKKIKVQDDPTLERDTYSSAILNADRSAYNAAVRRKKHIKAQERTIVELQNQVDSLLAWRDEVVQLLAKKDNK